MKKIVSILILWVSFSCVTITKGTDGKPGENGKSGQNETKGADGKHGEDGKSIQQTTFKKQ